jgi:hypothetical protein
VPRRSASRRRAVGFGGGVCMAVVMLWAVASAAVLASQETDEAASPDAQALRHISPALVR